MSKIKKFLRDGLVHIFRCLGGLQNKVVFVSFGGKSYSDNPRAISEALHELAPSTKIVWLFKDGYENEKLPKYIVRVNATDTKAVLWHLATSAAYVNNFLLNDFAKSKKQMFIQTWHGDKAFKKVLYDAASFTGYAKEAVPGYCDLAIAGSEYGKKQYITAFRYVGRILMEGTPRNDRLVHLDKLACEKIKKDLGISVQSRILLYAPTLRKEQAENRQLQDVGQLNIGHMLDLLEEKSGSSWVCLLRAHPSIVGLGGYKVDRRILDVTHYEDMADLLSVADMLITDYSSCAGDFALLRRPIVLFQGDRHTYLEKDRDLYFNMEDSPYWVAENESQMEQILSEFTPEAAEKNCEDILRFYGDVETGYASKRVAEEIINWIERRSK